GLVAAIVLLAAIVPALLVWSGHRMELADERVAAAEREALEAEREASLLAESHRYAAALQASARLRAQPHPGWRWEVIDLTRTAAAAGVPDEDRVAVRSALAAALGSIDLRRLGSVADGQYAGAIAIAPDGRVAVAPQLCQPLVPFGFVSLVDSAAGTTIKLPFAGGLTLSGIDATSALAFSPDGRWLFLGLRSGKVLRGAVDRPPLPTRTSWNAHDGEVVGLAFSPDWQWVYTAGHDGQVKQWPIAAREPKPAAVWPPNPANPKGWHRRALAFWNQPRPTILAVGPDGAKLPDPVKLVGRTPP